jgi:GH24 family phage-related lysozyme (muramidase)
MLYDICSSNRVDRQSENQTQTSYIGLLSVQYHLGAGKLKVVTVLRLMHEGKNKVKNME